MSDQITLQDIVEAALKIIPAGWQPIETAPTGVRILVCLPPNDRNFAEKYGRLWVMRKSKDGDFTMPAFSGFSPTHWMPLPALPDTYDAKAHEACYP